jgi:hypothetical protein
MSEQQIPSGDFRIFVQKIAMQGFYALGLIEVPGAPKQQPNPEMARGVIDDLTMLREKCASNLEEGETLTLDKFISDLQNQVAELSK